MPYIDILSRDDYVCLWYRTNTLYSNVGSFDREKPTIIMLHPQFLDSTWLDKQVNDPRMDLYNIIAFDMRVCGRSRSRPSALHDNWVEAADIAYAHHALHLPSCHIFAVENLSVNCALRFAILFPELCQSLTLCNVPPPTELNWVFSAYDELLQSWCYAEDLDSFEHAGKEASQFVAGDDCDPDLQDDLIAFWEINLPPAQRLRTVEMINVILNRLPLKPEDLVNIHHPVLIIQAEHCSMCPMKYAQKMATDLVNAQGGAHLYTVKGATGSLTVVPTNASIVNQVFAKFLSRLPHVGSDLVRPAIPVEERMKTALSKLAGIAGDTSIAYRDPNSPLSFSCVTPEVHKSQLESLKFYAKDLHKAFSPLDANGRPQRKYSDRRKEHWFCGERDGLSYAESDLVMAYHNYMTQQQLYQEEESHMPRSQMPSSEPVSRETAEDGRLRRMTLNVNSVDRQVLKGSMSKITTSAGVPMHLSKLTPSQTLSRLL